MVKERDLAAAAALARMSHHEVVAAANSDDEDEEGAVSDAAMGVSGELQREHAGPSPATAQRGGHKSGKNNPFVEYEDREQRLQYERRWLQQEDQFMGVRMRSLQHETVQARIRHLGKPSTKGVGRNCFAIGQEWVLEVGLPEQGPKKKGAGAAAPQPGTTGRREATASVKSLRSLQKEMKESLRSVEKAHGEESTGRARTRG